MIDTKTNSVNHPCFDKSACHSDRRVHLPVAAGCNIQCGFCNRKMDCVNESRPGVTSTVLSPHQALFYLKRVADQYPVSVAGIAGPGDPFNEPAKTLETLRLVKATFPDTLLCVSSNGLNVLPWVPELAKIGVSHFTLTINAVDEKIGAQIYPWIRAGKQIFRGTQGARVLLENQLASLRALKDKGITVKINSIIIPGINDHHIADVAKEVSERGADIFNAIPLIPVEDTMFQEVEEPDTKTVSKIRKESAKYLPQMTHCQRCRADAAGLLGKDNQFSELDLLQDAGTKPIRPEENRPLVAVASREGMLISQHLGEAEHLYIYEYSKKEGTTFKEMRKCPLPGGGDSRWESLAQNLLDCRAILVAGAGPSPQKILTDQGLQVHIMEGMISSGVEAVFTGKGLEKMTRKFTGCGSGCSGTGAGCG